MRTQTLLAAVLSLLPQVSAHSHSSRSVHRPRTRLPVLLPPQEELSHDELSPLFQRERRLVDNGWDDSARLRYDLLYNSYYDRNSYPWEFAWRESNNGNIPDGLPVELQINFHRVFSVNTIDPMVDLIVWFRLQWVDRRLSWIPEQYGNLTKMWFWIDGNAGGETSEIWTPDIELWNLEQGLTDSLANAYAVVQADGTVFWSRPGHLRPACKFIGLDRFPFDKLTCTMEFGSWAYSGKYIRLVKGGADNTGFSMGGSQTAGESYNEFSFVQDDPITCLLHVYPPYPNAPDEDWPVLMYNVTIQRSWQPYVRGYFTTQIMLNIAAFSSFWLPPSCGERIGLSITALLALVASEIVVAGNLPQASDYTWFQKFSFLSMSFAVITLLENVMVLHFFCKRNKDMRPWWWIKVKPFFQARKELHATGKDVWDARNNSPIMTEGESEMIPPKNNLSTVKARNIVREDALDTSYGQMDDNHVEDSTSGQDDDGVTVEKKIVDGTKTTDNQEKILSFLELSMKWRNECMKQNQEEDTGSGNGSNRRIIAPPRDADDFFNQDEIDYNAYWRVMAYKIDDVARCWIPLAFIVGCSIVFSEVI